MSATLAKLGIGQKTGIDLHNEFIGINPNKEWKEQKLKNLGILVKLLLVLLVKEIC